MGLRRVSFSAEPERVVADGERGEGSEGQRRACCDRPAPARLIRVAGPSGAAETAPPRTSAETFVLLVC